MIRSKMTQEERREAKDIEDSLKVSSYADKILQSMKTGQPIDPDNMGVPDYGKYGGSNLEPQPVHMNMEEFFNTAATSMGDHEVGGAISDAHRPRGDDGATFEQHSMPESRGPKISQNQFNALQKYPSLIELLGQDEHGEKLAQKVLEDVRKILVDKIGSNGKDASDLAIVCVADRQNLKQYFRGDGWVCRVIASGPFRGDEAIFYSKDHNKSMVLRKDSKGEYQDVSSNGFNVIGELAEGTTNFEEIENCD